MKRLHKSNSLELPKRRTKYEIWAEILELCLDTPLHQSMILKRLRLTTKKAQEALGFLLERHLIKQVKDLDGKWFQFHTTDKGKDALEEFYSLIINYFTPQSK